MDDDYRDDYLCGLLATVHYGRCRMREAFVELTMVALRAGVPQDEISPLHGMFFDGHVEVRRAPRAIEMHDEIKNRRWF